MCSGSARDRWGTYWKTFREESEGDLLPADTEARVSVGKTYRTPTFEELYTRNIFSGHAFLGNENLLPEDGISAELNLKKTSLFNERKSNLSNKLGASYNNIKDKIHNVLLDINAGTPRTQYINISKYQSYNLMSTNNLHLPQWDFSLGASLVWISQKIETEKYKNDDRFLMNLNANASASYNIKKWNTAVSAYYKLVGKSQMWLASGDGYVIADLDPYGWLDLSVQKQFLKHKQLKSVSLIMKKDRRKCLSFSLLCVSKLREELL